MADRAGDTGRLVGELGVRQRSAIVLDRGVVGESTDHVLVEGAKHEAGHQRPLNTGGRFSSRAAADSRTSSLAHTAAKLASIAASSADRAVQHELVVRERERCELGDLVRPGDRVGQGAGAVGEADGERGSTSSDSAPSIRRRAVPPPASAASVRIVHASTAMPLRAVGTANFAVVSATLRSHAIASCVPAPIAGPLTAAISGTDTWVSRPSIP